MKTIAVLYPGDIDASKPNDEWVEEYEICKLSELFRPVIFDDSRLSQFNELKFNMKAQSKKEYCLFRCKANAPYTDDIFHHSLKRNGYYPVFDELFSYFGPESYLKWKAEAKRYFPNKIEPYGRFIGHYSKEPRWFPDCLSWTHKKPLIAKNNMRMMRNHNNEPVLILGRMEHDEIDEIIGSFCPEGVKCYTDTYLDPPMWFEDYVNIAIMNGVSVEWRLFIYRNKVLYKCLKPSHLECVDTPEPPKELIEILLTDDFISVDVALDRNEGWKILKILRGEQAKVPIGGSVVDFYRALEIGLTSEPKIPEWAWCPVGRITQNHSIGENHKVVNGSRHFDAGTKVYMINAFWGMGAERCTVLGKPKYSKNYVGVVIDTDLIVDFELERVTDRDVLNAMFTNRLQEPFERQRNTNLWGYWGQGEEDRRDILGFIESVNRYRKESPYIAQDKDFV